MLFTNEICDTYIFSKQRPTVKLGDVVTVKIGRTPARNREEYWQIGEIPWVSIADLNNGRVFSTKESISRLAFEEVFSEQIISPGTILFSFKLTIGKVGILDIPAVHNEAIASLTMKSDRIDRDYLFYLLQSLDYSVYLDTYLKGKTLNKDKIMAISLPLPPFPEQRAIAHILQTVQQAIQTRRKELELERERKAALMQYLFTHGTRNEPTKQSEVGEIPESWEVVRVADIAKVQSGGTPDRTKPEYWNGDIPWVKTGEINYNIILDTEEKISRQGLENSSAKIISAGTLLIAMYGQGITRGRVAILGIDASINQACAAIHFEDKTFTEFLFHYFTFKYEAIRGLGHGANQKNLNAILIKSFFVPQPNEDERRKIAKYLSACDDKIAALEKETTLHEELFRALLDELMTGRISTVPLIEELEKGTLTNGQGTPDGTGTAD